jgi:hypothetical protein
MKGTTKPKGIWITAAVLFAADLLACRAIRIGWKKSVKNPEMYEIMVFQ